ncbi:Coenzyme F420 hydrogenase/dehydrogenase, beta subunit C-terminal domain [Bacteroides difficilis]|uniref:Coenzyme F420 hydrogenase/dehydrogenase, beta subunit C-terminal domain n=1 Tax=Bacteroides difficilis TaxID=2763021 RepID=UPI003AB0B9A7
MNINGVTACCGCMSCVSVCPKKCISLVTDILGFIYPQIDEDVCVDCSACTKVCPEIVKQPLEMPKHTFAGWCKDEKTRKNCTSGGLATALSRFFVEQGGVVYGSAFIPPFDFKHIRCVDIEDLVMICGSKYVQSAMSEVYEQMKNDLCSGLNVMFIGTPCQVAGIKVHFSKYAEQLYLIDILCHGTPSVKLLKDNLQVDDLTNIKFRDNNCYQISYRTNGMQIIRPQYKDLYLKGFLKGVILRESCYSCRYTQKCRVGDLSLGDFWGYKNENKGISLCLTNTIKGKMLLTSCRSIEYNEETIDMAYAHNQPLRGHIAYSWRTYLFRKCYSSIGFKWASVLAMPDIWIKSLFIRMNK